MAFIYRDHSGWSTVSQWTGRASGDSYGLPSDNNLSGLGGGANGGVDCRLFDL